MKTLKTLTYRLILVFSGCVMLSSCAIQKSISGKNKPLSSESLATIRANKIYTFWYNNPAKEKDVVKISYVDSLMITGNIYSSKRKGEPFAMSQEEILQQVYKITTTSGEAIAGNIIIVGLVVAIFLYAVAASSFWTFTII
jgi:hypothetical protein